MRKHQFAEHTSANCTPIQKESTLVVDNCLGKLNPGGCYGINMPFS